ncbi:Sau3AI family type II restriction endonuclease [uncultured Slackia sp.]|uniref:Sau3AI family type II restriction endonuclease n=1 Tax=uncultured Slackia sp. TaxID=665903 RepID=UPI002674D090|nr:Sau3AI family type II restriction endonuclease [uncultured Slackia sp.]
MAEKGEALPYDRGDKQSIYHYALNLRGSTLREKSDAEQVADIRRNKGSFGNAVEYYYFFIDNNSDSAPDFKEAGIELKTTPLKRNKDGGLSSKERLVIGMIDYMEVVNETFETSHMVEKAEDLLLISYLWEPETDPLDYRIELVEMVDLKGLPEGDLAQIKDDWETVVDKVHDGRAHEISGSDTLYLEACTKAANSSVRRKQPFSDIEAKPRAWALKASFMTAMPNRLIENMQAIGRGEGEGAMTLIELVRSRFAPYFGLTEAELGARFGYGKEGRRKPKNLCALITRRILGVSDDAKIEEFEKAGIVPKTMRIKRSGMPKESMSFPHFDYFELAETPYEDSDFASYMEQKYLFVVYREDGAGEYRLSDVALWQMPEGDVDEAERCYEEMRRRVIEGHAQNSVRSSENRCCHVRPHGRDSKDTLPTPQGDMVVKKCFWLNAGYLKGEVERITKRS